MDPKQEFDDFNNKLFEKVNELHSGNIYTDSQTGKIVVINYEGIRDLAKSLLEDKKLSSFYELGITKALETYVKTNPRLFEDLTLTDDIYYETNFMKHVEEKPSIFGKACNYLVNTVRNHRNASIGIVGGSITGLVGIPFLEKYLFHNDTFVKASESDNTIGIYSNNIDWELNKSTILQTAQETGVQIYRITDPEEFSNYDKILVLGGHKAYIDKYMPINIAKDFLNDEEKNNLEENDDVLIKDISNPFGINPEQELMIYAGSDRDFTKEIPMGDYDFRGVSGKLEGEGLPNIIEFMIGTRYDRFDTDGDNLNDYFEWKFSEKNGGLYDPLVPNDRYLLYLVANEKFKKVPSNFEDYIFNKQRFSKDNVIFLTKNDATFSNFKKEINKIAEKSDKNDFIYIYIAGHDQYGEKKTFMDGDVPYKTIDKIIDTINSKAIIIELCGCLDDEYMHILKEGPCPRIVSSGPIFNGISSTKISKEKIDKNHDGYISIKEMIRYLKTTESDSGLIDLDNIASKVYLGSYNFINKSYWQKPQE